MSHQNLDPAATEWLYYDAGRREATAPRSDVTPLFLHLPLMFSFNGSFKAETYTNRRSVASGINAVEQRGGCSGEAGVHVLPFSPPCWGVHGRSGRLLTGDDG